MSWTHNMILPYLFFQGLKRLATEQKKKFNLNRSQNIVINLWHQSPAQVSCSWQVQTFNAHPSILPRHDQKKNLNQLKHWTTLHTDSRRRGFAIMMGRFCWYFNYNSRRKTSHRIPRGGILETCYTRGWRKKKLPPLIANIFNNPGGNLKLCLYTQLNPLFIELLSVFARESCGSTTLKCLF